MTPPVEKLIFVQEASGASLKHGKQKSENIGQMSAKQTAESETPFLSYFTGTATVLGYLSYSKFQTSFVFQPVMTFKLSQPELLK